MTKERVADLFAEHHGRPRVEAPEALLAEARQALRQRYFEAEVGITGANFLVAETGSVVLVTNEGNAELTQGLPRTHIVVASLEKVVPTLEDACTLLRVLARSATGQEFSAYTTIADRAQATEPTSTGRPSFHVVLVDNGRSAGGRQRVPGHPALHPLRRLHEPLPGLPDHRRPRLRLGLSGADGRGADAAVHRHRAGATICPARRPSAAAARRSARSGSRCPS